MVLEGVCKELVSFFKCDFSVCPYSVKDLIMDGKLLASKFDVISFSWVSRAANRPALALAAYGLNTDSQVLGSSRHPILLEDYEF